MLARTSVVVVRRMRRTGRRQGGAVDVGTPCIARSACAGGPAGRAEVEEKPPKHISAQLMHEGNTANIIINEHGSIDTLKHIIMNKCYIRRA